MKTRRTARLMRKASASMPLLAASLVAIILLCFGWNMGCAGSSAGLRSGDWMIYDEVTTRNGTVPPPQYNIISRNISIVDVASSNVTLHTVILLEDNNTIAINYTLDVESATLYNSTALGTELGWLMTANLSAGDTVTLLIGGHPKPLEINETVYRQYLNATFEVNHINYNELTGYPYQSTVNLYYFKATGVLAEMLLDQTGFQLGMFQNVNTRIVISATNFSSEPPAYSTLPILVTAIAIATVTTVIAVRSYRRKRISQHVAASSLGPDRT
jgi:hypothetical protein